MASFLHFVLHFMKPLKLLACLVTLQLTCGFTLQAADPQPFRQWTDAQGRAITARIVDATAADSVKIEREDGCVFTVPLKTFSAADQSYVKNWLAEQADIAAGRPILKEPDAATWALLNSAGNQPASAYSNTRLDHIIETINQRITVNDVKTAAGEPLALRTEPSSLAARIQISGEMPRMSLATFIQSVARNNQLVVKIDSAGLIVLVDNPSESKKSEPSFLGVSVSQN
jgi:hypothetical protein